MPTSNFVVSILTMKIQGVDSSNDLFVGRTAELNVLESMFASSAASSVVPPRLLTLTGVGGSGKTRLARELMQRVQTEFVDDSAWIDLAPLSDAMLIARAVSGALGLQEQSDHPALETLVTELAPKQILLVLDNCEHLRDAVAALCWSLLARCPELSILTTSREPLGIAGEIVYPVLPLALPANQVGENVLDSDAVRLFVVRAQQAWSGFELTEANIAAVARVCTQLDGLPLAIELAAARVPLMTVSEIAERLNNALGLLTRPLTPTVPRHQTLRAAMDWSYHLLSENEQALLRRLSIFAGGFTLEAAEQVCGDTELYPSTSSHLILDLLTDLIHKSLLVIENRQEGSPTRYGMLETVRQYTFEKLQEQAEEALLCTRHRDWFVALAERAEPELTGEEQGRWLAREDSELANFRVALQRAAADNATAQGLRLANALWRYWDRRGNYSEAQSWYSLLLNGDLTQTPPRVRGRALYHLGVMHYRLSQFDEAIRFSEGGLAVARELDDRRGMASISNLLGIMATDKGSFDRANEFYEQALALYKELTDIQNIPRVLNNFGNLARQRGQYRRALEYYEQSLALKRQAGDAAETALGLNDVGAIILALGEYAHGQAILQESLAIYRGLGDKRGMYLTLTNMGRAALYLDDYAKSHTLLHEAEQIGMEWENKGDLAYGLLSLGELAQAKGEYVHAQSLYEKTLGLARVASEHVSIAQALYHLAMNALESGQVNTAGEYGVASLKLYQEQDHKPGMAAGLEVMAGIAAARQEFPRAAEFLGAAMQLREQAETPTHPHERAALEKIITASRRALGVRNYESALQRGRSVPLAEIIAEALADAPQPTSSRAYGLPEPAPELQAFGLGQSLVIHDEQPLTLSEWTYAKSKELFFYLLTQHTASREQIGVELWADASPAQLRRIFHRVLGTLRKALGRSEWITFENGAYALNRALPFSYDVDAFEEQLTQARRLLRSSANGRSNTSESSGASERPHAIMALQRAVELYQGDFLSDVQGGDWILFRREELRKDFLQALLTLGSLLSERSEYAQAVAVYERALAQDNYLEVAHRELMRAWARQGEVTLALKQYQTLVELLHVEFDAQAAPETRAVYERLRKGEPV